VIYQHPLAYLLGLEGVALLRAFNGEYDRDFTEARLAEIRALLESAGQFGDGVTTRAVLRPGGHLVISDSRMDYTLVNALPDGGCGYLPHYNRFTSEYLTAALPLGLQVRRCEELRSPRRDPSSARSPERLLPDHPSDIWMLQAWVPAASVAAHNGNPMLIFWHFQLAR
jgi:hypothetical protein